MIDEHKYRVGFFIRDSVSDERIDENGNIVDYESRFNGTLEEARQEAKKRIRLSNGKGRFWLNIPDDIPTLTPVDSDTV